MLQNMVNDPLIQSILNESNEIENEPSIEESNDNLKSPSTKAVRVHHLNNQNKLCFAFDIEYNHYALWRQGETPLRAKYVRLPNGNVPQAGTHISCGTCLTTKFGPLVNWTFDTVYINM